MKKIKFLTKRFRDRAILGVDLYTRRYSSCVISIDTMLRTDDVRKNRIKFVELILIRSIGGFALISYSSTGPHSNKEKCQKALKKGKRYKLHADNYGVQT